MRPRQQTARHRRPALINTSQRSEGAWESCLARNAACGRGRFLLNGVGATRQGPRCQVALGRGCDRWRGFPPRRRWGLSVAITKGTCETGTSPPCPRRLNIVRADLRTARTWPVSRRTAGIGGRHAPQRNAGHLGIDRETRQRPTAQELRRSDGVGHRPFPAATGPDASRAAFRLDGASGHDTRHRASPGASMNSKTCG